MPKNIEDEIDQAIHGLRMNSRVSKLGPDPSNSILEAIRSRFTSGSSTPWWSQLVGDVQSFNPSDRNAFRRIPGLLNQTVVQCFLLPEQPRGTPLVYRGDFKDLCDIIDECFYFEFCFVDIELMWIACENHHGQIVTCEVR